MLVVLAALGVLHYGTGALPSQSRQEAVAERGARVMPFDLERPLTSEATGSGGVEGHGG